ncbi:uncharacterized protein LOC135825732 [Sycon ciliatum]|uniref:uncharacterized protein LOC135825732 n=1 Tax=Sycon ciliatum TaxID=27933 RepID=UPI0031F66EA2
MQKRLPVRQPTSLGTRSIACSKTGTWTPRIIPHCQARPCPKPVFDENTTGITWLESGLRVKSKVEYRCASGYRFSGTAENTATILCQRDETWSQQKLCEPRTCPDPPFDGNTTTVITQLRSVLRFKDEVEYRCASGYQFSGTTDNSSTIVCQSDGTWSNQRLCEPTGCPTPMFNLTTTDVATNLSSMLQSDNEVQYSCAQGYTFPRNMPRTASIVCQDNATWSMQQPCQRIEPLANPKTSATGIIVPVAVAVSLSVAAIGLVLRYRRTIIASARLRMDKRTVNEFPDGTVQGPAGGNMAACVDAAPMPPSVQFTCTVQSFAKLDSPDGQETTSPTQCNDYTLHPEVGMRQDTVPTAPAPLTGTQSSKNPVVYSEAHAAILGASHAVPTEATSPTTNEDLYVNTGPRSEDLYEAVKAYAGALAQHQGIEAPCSTFDGQQGVDLSLSPEDEYMNMTVRSREISGS